MDRRNPGENRIVEDLLQIEDLKVHFPIRQGLLARRSGFVCAVNGVSLTLGKGETLGIVGESGCGKTTTGMAAMNLIRPTGGRILFRGEDMAAMPAGRQRQLRKEMQIIFQDPYSSLNPRMTLNQILNEPLRIHGLHPGGARGERIADLLEKVGLTADHGRRYPHELSGGQRQRVGIARALALSPQVIIGDEPVSALDVSIQAQILNLLVRLQAEYGLAYLIISHDLAVVEYVCDRIAVMYLGRVMEIASYRELYDNPRHPYTEALMSSIPAPDPRVRRKKAILSGDVPNPVDLPSGCCFHPRCSRRMDQCTRQVPMLKEVGTWHRVACFLYGH
jgi:oligopeptide/dipeptide ABC transporter ATP-binding protein